MWTLERAVSGASLERGCTWSICNIFPFKILGKGSLLRTHNSNERGGLLAHIEVDYMWMRIKYLSYLIWPSRANGNHGKRKWEREQERKMEKGRQVK